VDYFLADFLAEALGVFCFALAAEPLAAAGYFLVADFFGEGEALTAEESSLRCSSGCSSSSSSCS
jgi:hypothetical protein